MQTEMKFKFFVSILLAGIVSGTARPSQKDEGGSCSDSGADRRECGWLGIDEATCLKRGCCWDTTDPNAKWCFLKKSVKHICGPVAPSQRVDCGWLGITKRQCQDRLCCWDDSVPNSKWCYYEEGAPAIGCYIYNKWGTCRSNCKPGERPGYVPVCKRNGKICCYRPNS